MPHDPRRQRPRGRRRAGRGGSGRSGRRRRRRSRRRRRDGPRDRHDGSLGRTRSTMSFLSTNPLALRALYAVAMAKAFLRFGNPRRREADRHRVAFYDRAWREAAEELGATWEPVGAGISEIALDEFRTRVVE